jgi:hypothetical protein
VFILGVETSTLEADRSAKIGFISPRFHHVLVVKKTKAIMAVVVGA